jgi:sugar/nucleoside kinase (ribokinase family)
MLFSHNLIFSVPAFPVQNVLDPTGAGDSFAGGMVGYLAAARSFDDAALRRAVAFGIVMASLSVMSFGPQQLGDPTFPEIQARYREFRKITVLEDIVEL